MCRCNKYLDVVPDNVITIDNAFTLKREAEKYLFTCYSFLPTENHPINSLGFIAGDECWLPRDGVFFRNTVWDIAKGNQNKVNPYANYWDGTNGLYAGIRHCNIFLENVSNTQKVYDLEPDMRTRWLGEVEFLKAYYHFYLLRNYGPIPIVDVALPISSTPNEVRVKRAPVDSVVNYIANLLDKAAEKLPMKITDVANEMGRITKPIAMAVKARLLVTAASPLFNGNSDFTSLKNEREALFPASYDPTKWQRAANAAKEAIEIAHQAGFELYKFQGLNKISDTTRTQMSIRNAVCERWNSELIWGSTRNTSLTAQGPDYIQSICMGQIDPKAPINLAAYNQLCAPLKIAQLFYTDHGVPINEDVSYNFSNFSELRTATRAERYNLIEGYQTARLNFDREPRFYADLGFDGSIWYMQNSLYGDSATYDVRAKQGQRMNEVNTDYINMTGYWIKKLVNWKFAFSGLVNAATSENYPWPMFRLADLYLLYAEALNEASGPSTEVYTYLDKVRARAGLGGVVTSWNQYSNSPGKPTTKEGLRSIIHQERSIEMAFEGSRLWDLRRWKEAATELNKPITGWDRTQAAPADYYRVVNIFSQKFIAPRDYFWPIREYEISVNPNLVQNIGW
ncbi:RagB/SusD family nutrient uptake outer membrane protein [Niastella caeni]|uniref:RagB/SusD family nutrient uptake outer membrane protein n=2 Tax=Niastella caeni TaxID=2569763 RepID=A0A4S8HEZ2_9BACT|nr:RagB/SusD family nutrient uptake outer membrane protein [Niastella caeni]